MGRLVLAIFVVLLSLLIVVLSHLLLLATRIVMELMSNCFIYCGRKKIIYEFSYVERGAMETNY